jgi:hypothetical protein
MPFAGRETTINSDDDARGRAEKCWNRMTVSSLWCGFARQEFRHGKSSFQWYVLFFGIFGGDFFLSSEDLYASRGGKCTDWNCRGWGALATESQARERLSDVRNSGLDQCCPVVHLSGLDRGSHGGAPLRPRPLPGIPQLFCSPFPQGIRLEVEHGLQNAAILLLSGKESRPRAV